MKTTLLCGKVLNGYGTFLMEHGKFGQYRYSAEIFVNKRYEGGRYEKAHDSSRTYAHTCSVYVAYRMWNCESR
ncbi:hypothetical protein CE91St63_32730 [[Clostridium] hylemonae]|nr:hypothetical protein CE91St63_32730 [[Clostridium] hylemonae]